MRKVGYLTKEGFRNLKVNRLMSVASVTVLFSCLMLIGVAFMLLVNIESFISGIESENVIMVYAQLETGTYSFSQLGDEIRAIDNVATVEPIKKDVAYEQILSEMDEGLRKYLENVDENPLPDAYKVTVADMAGFGDVVGKIKTLQNVLRVHENSSLAQELSALRNSVTYISVGIIGLLLIVSLFIIANTIKVTMFSRRLEIDIMKSVGATRAFIRWPFMVEGIIIGIISGGLALLAVWLINRYALSSITSMFEAFGTAKKVYFSTYAPWLALCFAGVGIIIGTFGSATSISKYLRERKFIDGEI